MQCLRPFGASSSHWLTSASSCQPSGVLQTYVFLKFLFLTWTTLATGKRSVSWLGHWGCSLAVRMTTTCHRFSVYIAEKEKVVVWWFLLATVAPWPYEKRSTPNPTWYQKGILKHCPCENCRLKISRPTPPRMRQRLFPAARPHSKQSLQVRSFWFCQLWRNITLLDLNK